MLNSRCHFKASQVCWGLVSEHIGKKMQHILQELLDETSRVNYLLSLTDIKIFGTLSFVFVPSLLYGYFSVL